MSYRFTVCELKTGRVLDDAPMVIEGDVSRLFQGYGTGSLGLPILDEQCPENWEQLILPKRSLILVLDEDDRIVWHGIPVDRSRNLSDVVTYPCVTIEGYFLSRFVPDLTFSGVDQALIARRLAQVAGDAAGIPLLYDTPLTGVARDREYADDENARVLTRLQELAAVENGFNWAVDVDWADDDHTRVDYTFRTGYPHLGRRLAHPDHLFEAPGNVIDFDYGESWADGDAATHVRAIGDGEGAAKTMSAPVIDQRREAAGWPRWEERRSFSGVTNQKTIDTHAAKTAAQLFGGQQVITLTVRNTLDSTALGDLSLGDSASIIIDTASLQLEQVWVVVAWSLSQDGSTYKPTLARLGA